MENNNQHTQFFCVELEKSKEAKQIVKDVHKALSEKGYNPISQLVGYILSGDPTYITSHDNARSRVRQIERDELLEEIIKSYIDSL